MKSSASRELFKDRRILTFVASAVLFHFANAAMLPLVGQKSSDGLKDGAAVVMSACIIAAQIVMIPVALAASRLAASWGRKPVFLIGFGVLPIRGLLYCLSVNPVYLVGVQLLDGIGAGIFGVVSVLVVADLTRGTGRFNLTQGALATATGIGAGSEQPAGGLRRQGGRLRRRLRHARRDRRGRHALLRAGHARDPSVGSAVWKIRTSPFVVRGDRRLDNRSQISGDPELMNEFDKPVVVVVPGDLHLTEPDLENVAVGPPGRRRCQRR